MCPDRANIAAPRTVAAPARKSAAARRALVAMSTAITLGAAAVGCVPMPSASGRSSAPAAARHPATRRAAGRHLATADGRSPPGQSAASRATADPEAAPQANTSVIGLALSGVGTHFSPPKAPTIRPYGTNCHQLIDPAFSGKCTVVQTPTGTVAGVVEEETGAFNAAGGHVTARGGPSVQERDLVWHRQGDHWELAQVHTFNNPGLPTLLWNDDIERDHDPKLVFVTPTDIAGFGNELDVVEGTGKVTLYRFLGQGFAVVPSGGGLVTYVPGSTEQRPADSYYDQTLIGFSGGHWMVFSEQYVPYGAALSQHHGAFWDRRAVPAS
jgi:hypothetical protein